MKHYHNFDHPSATFHSYIFPSNEQKAQNISKIPKISGSCSQKRIKQYEVLILFLTSLDLLNDVEKSTSTKKNSQWDKEGIFDWLSVRLRTKWLWVRVH